MTKAEKIYNRGVSLHDNGHHQRAIKQFRQLLDIYPEHAKTHYNLGVILNKQERYDEAEDHYRQALDIDPEYTRAHFNLGLLLADQERYDGAEDHYRRALNIDPEYAQAHFSLGNLLSTREQYDEAEDHYRQALDIDPANADVHENLGVLLKRQERYDEAEDHYRQALDINPKHAPAHNNLGILLKGQGRYDEAEEHYRQALEINPESALTHANYVKLLAILDRHDQAKVHFKKARSIDGEGSPPTESYSEFISSIEDVKAENVTKQLKTRRVPEQIPCVPNVSIDYDTITKGSAIGAGGSADVTKATYSGPDDDLTLAIKEPRMAGTLQTEQVERMLEEAETWDRLDNHDYIVGVVDYGSKPIPWIAMEYMDGGHLGNRVKKMETPQALWTALAITKGVRHAHRRGIAHLDLKPENVLFRTVEDAWDVPKVADWGLSKHLLEHSNSVEGLTPQYAAPEQFDDSFGETNEITDVYQLGAVFYELFTGQPPFEESPAKAMQQVLNQPPTPPSEIADVPDQLDEILLTALAKEKDQRYEDIILLRNALQDLYDEW